METNNVIMIISILSKNVVNWFFLSATNFMFTQFQVEALEIAWA